MSLIPNLVVGNGKVLYRGMVMQELREMASYNGRIVGIMNKLKVLFQVEWI
jgi:hypothetical protein